MSNADIRMVLAAVCNEYCKYPSHALEGGYPLEFACNKCPVKAAVEEFMKEEEKMTENDKIALKHWLDNSARTAQRTVELKELSKQFGAQSVFINWDNTVFVNGIKPIAEAMGYILEEELCDGFKRIYFIHDDVKFYDYEEDRK